MSSRKYTGNITPEKIVEMIAKSRNIVLTTHVNPDGDAVGSMIAFYLMIEEYNRSHIRNEQEYIRVDMIIDDKLPKYMEHFQEKSLISRYDETILNREFDLFISLDCANEERYGSSVNIKSKCRESINIDHHISNTGHADFNYVEDVSSTSELIYQFLSLFGIGLTRRAADFMYLGIINDTGNFRHDNVTAETFRVCSEIRKAGTDNHKISDIIFGISMKKIDLIGDVYRNKAVDEGYRFIYYYLPYEKMKAMGIEKDDTDGIAEMLLRIEGTEISMLMREEEDGMIKGSLRSNDKYDVNEIASVFNGGGHIKAAGFKTGLPYGEIIGKIYEILEKDNEGM